MNVVKYTNALAVFSLLFIIYFLSVNFLGILYPTFSMSSWDLERYNSEYSLDSKCANIKNKNLKDECVKKDKDSFYNKKAVMFSNARFNSIRSFVSNIIMLFTVISYFLFFRRFVGCADCVRENKYDSNRKLKSSYRGVRK